MIDSIELKRNNLVEINGDIVKVYNVTDREINCEYSYDSESYSLGIVLEALNSIALTHEWLERCGFVKQSGGDWDGPKIEHENEIEWFCIRECGSGMFRLMGSEWPMGKPFRYVHQLQNIFFFHAGEELTIKETA